MRSARRGGLVLFKRISHRARDLYTIARVRARDFDYELPPELIAQHPLPERSASRLLCLDARGALADRIFSELPALLSARDLLVFNDTQVIPARLFGAKTTGGKVEVLVERILNDQLALAQVKASKSVRAGAKLRLEDTVDVTVLARRDELFELRFEDERSVMAVLRAHGHVPLPPYIRRPDDNQDRVRYQTVYGRQPGAVAAPTAGLHFDEALLAALRANGIEHAHLTLHVGAGTFQPVRVDDIHRHRLHAEHVEVSPAVCEAIARCKQSAGKVIAVGTTVVRSLESAAAGGDLQPFYGDTDLFITPGFRFKVVDALITNFHLPQSTLLMLVCAFGGFAPVMNAYGHAIAARYRFYSYGDAMFVMGRAPATAHPGCTR